MDNSPPPAYQAVMTAQQLTSASTCALQIYLAPIRTLAQRDIDKAISLGLGFVCAKETWKALKRFCVQQRDALLEMLRKDFGSVGIMVCLNKNKLYIVWNLSAWSRVMCEYEVIVCRKANGFYGIKLRNDHNIVWPSYPIIVCVAEINPLTPILTVVTGDVLKQVNGVKVKGMLLDKVVTLINMGDQVTLTICRK